MTITVTDLSVERGATTIFEDVSATVDTGEFVGIVGPNGAGKTTLLRTILGAVPPRSGHVTLDGDAITDLASREVSRRVAAVPQRTEIAFEFTVREVVEMGRHPHTPRLRSDPDPDQVTTALGRTEVSHLADRSIDAVSGGERQRVLLARALAQNTPGLLLDEPTASLDVNHQVRTLDLVADLASDGKSVLAAIHDLNLAARYCDRLVLLADGGIVARGPPRSVLTPAAIEAAFGTRAVVRPDPLTDAPVVTAFPAKSTARDATVHVVGGGTPAARAITALHDAGFTVTAGIVPAGDTVAETAHALGIDTVVAPPFEAPASETIETATAAHSAADVTLAVPGPTAATTPNTRLLEAADRRVILETTADTPSLPIDAARRTSLGTLTQTVTAALTDPERIPVSTDPEESHRT
ncbi:MAG: heme ABC transporter ATP-binding protein [Halobacteriaceae archaeon]